ncbi:hypothetical protein [Streptomyces sp. NPDC058466]|uniref:hypothetical protein n=1 Tax=Streptomyces sp. NPDC058466 TaxID=3346512 RepID=UPI00366598A0
MTDQPMVNNCEHHYETRILGGHPISVRICVFCRTPDWADLGEQAVELYRWGWQEGRAGKVAREALSAYDKPREAGEEARTTPDTPAASSDAADNPLREQIARAVESEVYEFRERTMFWPETGGVTEEIARLATRGAMKALAEHLDIGEEQAWCKACRRVWDGPRHRCETDAEQQAAGLREALTEVLACLYSLTRVGGSVIGYQTVNTIPAAAYDRWQAALQQAGGREPGARA